MRTGVSLGRHFPGRQIVLGRDSESISDPIEEGKHGRDVDRFGDLIFAPSRIAQSLHVLGRGAGGGLRNKLHVFKQCSFSRGQSCVFELPFENCRYTLITGSLDTQEVGVAIQSIRAPVQIGDVAGNHLLVAASQMAFGEVDGIREIDYLPKEVGPGAEALDDARNLGTPGPRAPVIVGRCRLTGRLRVLGDADLGRRLAAGCWCRDAVFLLCHTLDGTSLPGLEQELQSDLNDARTDISLNRSEIRRRRADVRIRQSQVRVIEEVEQFTSELEFFPLGDADVLDC